MDDDWAFSFAFFVTSAIAETLALFCKDWLQNQLRQLQHQIQDVYPKHLDGPSWRAFARSLRDHRDRELEGKA